MLKERVIAPGDPLLVQGITEANTDGTIFFRAAKGQQLILSTYDEERLLEVRKDEGRIGFFVFLIFSAMMSIGAALVAIGLLTD